eukprot:m.543079 g.543079  ORF g.543079 m.543079 type:complete len:99 (-) comp57667_c0_seq1:479-775(-)
MIAATSGSPAVEALLQAGAVSSITNKSGETAKDRAVKRSWAVVVNILQDQEEFLAQVGSLTKRAQRHSLQQSPAEPSLQVSLALLHFLFVVCLILCDS